MSNDTRSRPMTTETIHTCSYYCERPECVRRQRDELRDRMGAVLAQQPAGVDGAKETDLWRCTVCGRVGTVGRCCGEETREPFAPPSAPVGAEEMQRRLDREESDHGRTIDQRDAAEDALGRMSQAVTGRQAEWSSAWGYVDAIEEVEEHVAALAQQPAASSGAAASAEPYAWMIDGSNWVWFGEFGEIEAREEARRCGGTCTAFPIFRGAQQAAGAEPAVWVAADTLNSPHPACISSLAYMSQLDRERGREYVPLYAAPQQPAAQQQRQAVALPKLKRTHPDYSREEVQWVFGYNAALDDVMRLNKNTAFAAQQQGGA